MDIEIARMQNNIEVCPISHEELTINSANEFILVKSSNKVAEQASHSYYFIHTTVQHSFFGLTKCPITRNKKEYQLLYLKDLSAELKKQAICLAGNAEFNPFFKNKGLQRHIKIGTFSFKAAALSQNITLEKFKKLISNYPIQVNAIINTKKNYNLLQLFSAIGGAKKVQALIAAQSNIDTKDNDDTSPLHAAATGDHTETVQALIANTEAEVNATNKYGHTPLHISAFHGHTKTVQVLIDAKADIHAKDKNGYTPLHYAALHGHTSTAMVLIKRTLNLDIKDDSGHTPLHAATFYEHTEIVNALINAKADIHAKDIDQQTPLMYAAAKGYSKILKILLKAGEIINVKDKNKAIDFAKLNGHLSAVTIFQNYTLKETQALICAPKQESATQTTKQHEITDADNESEQIKHKHF